MKGKVFFTWVMILCVVKLNVQGEYHTETVPAIPMKEKITKLSFFYHVNLGGKIPTAVQIAQPNVTRDERQFLPFGTLFAVNNALRVGTKPTSKLIGRAKGLTLAASQEDDKHLILVNYQDIGFITGKFNGSSFIVCSRDPIFEPEHELAVVGGRQKLRMVTGFVKVQTVFIDFASGYGVFKYDVTLFQRLRLASSTDINQYDIV
ncbi:dirigent protein 15 [Ricinus communis]|uniref:Dirigent protein n=1 Tax=Ricinus communis TaxID=3988 RepID=B9RU82_RICCO|nr:dirigent protein 15 [Ricinus communis]EEF45094.1 conserved hypothetical protein [Ricinus communis]|eukprot:XP_002517301.1 dirigent protein 15 [Ricinus communis]